MALDVLGGRKNTAVNHSHYVVFEEMLSNAIDSYLIRRSRLPTAPPFWMRVCVKISQTDFFDPKFDVEISCTDNGAGFGEDEVKAFVTKDSTYKDLLQIPGIGKCKGAGRIQFFHHYERLAIDSVFECDGKIQRRKLQVDGSTRLVSEHSFVTTHADGSQIETTFTLKGRRPSALTSEQKADEVSVPQIFSAKAIVGHLYTTFLQRLIILVMGMFAMRSSSTTKSCRVPWEKSRASHCCAATARSYEMDPHYGLLGTRSHRTFFRIFSMKWRSVPTQQLSNKLPNATCGTRLIVSAQRQVISSC